MSSMKLFVFLSCALAVSAVWISTGCVNDRTTSSGASLVRKQRFSCPISESNASAMTSVEETEKRILLLLKSNMMLEKLRETKSLYANNRSVYSKYWPDGRFSTFQWDEYFKIRAEFMNAMMLYNEELQLDNQRLEGILNK